MNHSRLHALRTLAATVALFGGLAGRECIAQEGVLLTEDQAAAAVFPDLSNAVRQEVDATPEMRARLRTLLARVEPSVWEERYVTFKALRGAALLGYAIVVEEIGKHRPITFVVGVRPDGQVNDVAVMAYREAYGGDVRSKRFLVQYHGKSATDGVQPFSDIKNIAGATLSVEAASRAVKKALAVAQIAFDVGGGS